MDDLAPAERQLIVELLQVRVDALSKTQFRISCLLPLHSDNLQLPNPHVSRAGHKAEPLPADMSVPPKQDDGFALSYLVDMTQQSTD
jgi:hypothetical protein